MNNQQMEQGLNKKLNHPLEEIFYGEPADKRAEAMTPIIADYNQEQGYVDLDFLGAASFDLQDYHLALLKEIGVTKLLLLPSRFNLTGGDLERVGEFGFEIIKSAEHEIAPERKDYFKKQFKEVWERVKELRPFAKEMNAQKREEGVRSQVEKFLGISYEEAKNSMEDRVMEIQGILEKGTGIDMDPDNKVISYIGERSYYSKGRATVLAPNVLGGVANYSKVNVWHDGESYQKEFKYRDQYEAKNDQPNNNFGSTKIENIEKDGNDVKITILATAYNGTPKTLVFTSQDKKA